MFCKSYLAGKKVLKNHVTPWGRPSMTALSNEGYPLHTTAYLQIFFLSLVVSQKL